MKIARRVALAAAAGAVVGILVGGVWGRTFMFVLARLNPEEHGMDTDDGFTMGQFTLSGTINLLVVATVIGIVGGLVFLVLRGLRFGPAWFGTTSMSLGAAFVVGSMLVHADGIDFVLLEPLGLAIALTLSMPLFFGLGIVRLGDRWIGHEPTFWQRLPTAVPWAARGVLTVLALVCAVDLVTEVVDILDGNRFS